MAYTAPNTFSDGTKINGSQVEQNIDALQSYVNGGVSAVDIDPSALNNYFGLKHVMKGEYIATNNRYEFATGVNQGTLGINQAGGYAANIIGDGSISGSGIDFYLEEDADVFVHITAYPRPYYGNDLDQLGLTSQRTSIAILKTGDAASKATTLSAQMSESEFGVNASASNDGGILGAERRRPFYGIFSGYLPAGEHSYQIIASTAERSVPIFFYQINIYAYYRETTA
tara:strand:+ start:3350 stop:4033 length:684 start_codon:yes stop_codon:yes gene_type:complete